jgi:hypothetical protein
MRLFQNSGIYPSYRSRLDNLLGETTSFAGQRDIFLADRFGALHFLKPVLDGDPDAFFTNGDDERLQRAWARENGMRDNTAMADILLAQIEAHGTEVLYNLDPMRYGNAFLARLPGCVKRTIAWRAAPSGGGDFDKHDLIVNNFPTLLQGYRDQGMKAAYFAPGHDPVMDSYAANTDRPIDVLFVGGYSRHHQRRAVILEAVAALRAQHKIVFHLDRSRMTRLAETPAGWVGPLFKHRRPRDVRTVSTDPVFGLDLYKAISRAKIVINGAVDMAGSDRGNMRCWEAMGCGAMLLSDAGAYPEGMVDGQTMVTYKSSDPIIETIGDHLTASSNRSAIAHNGAHTIRNLYTKAAQWSAFESIVSAL